MNISSLGGTNANWAVSRQSNSIQQSSGSPGKLQIPEDQLDLSPMARMMMELESLEQTNTDRADLIARIREEINQGTYDTDEKLEMAFQKLIQQISSGEE